MSAQVLVNGGVSELRALDDVSRRVALAEAQFESEEASRTAHPFAVPAPHAALQSLILPRPTHPTPPAVPAAASWSRYAAAATRPLEPAYDVEAFLAHAARPTSGMFLEEGCAGLVSVDDVALDDLHGRLVAVRVAVDAVSTLLTVGRVATAADPKSE